jgi:hypothetical protein
MKRINHDELYEHLCGFLKAKGVALQQGSYPNKVQKGCKLLADAINLSQAGLQRAKVEVDKKLDQMRQVIHEKTAPKPPRASPPPQSPPPKAASAATTAQPKKPRASRKRQTRRSRAVRK